MTIRIVRSVRSGGGRRCHGDAATTRQRKFAAGHVPQMTSGAVFVERRDGDRKTTHCLPCAREFFGFKGAAA